MTITDKDYLEIAKNKSLVLNDKWYVICKDWYDQWIKYCNEGSSLDKIGKITNSQLLDINNELNCEHLLSHNYELVPEKVWKFLIGRYGIDCNCNEKVFERYVIESHNDYVVDIQPLNLIISVYGKENKISATFSRGKTLRDIYDFIEDRFAVSKPFRILQKLKTGDFDVVKVEEDITLGDAGLSNGEHIYIDTQDKDGEWMLRKCRNRSAYNGKLVDGRVLGVCGLCNLGNTCFMNSALQCISNAPPLTYYFIRNNWQNDLNVSNPLGMHGRLAERYYQLLELIWVKGSTYTVPRDFKIEVAKFAPQFSGYAQHDSHELMMFVLDGLHEDLNRIQKKPYIESIDDDNLPLIQKAEDAWKYHRMRNDSIVVENFHGLLKSKVVCPDCHYVSITFDPFASLSLPLVVTYPQSFILKPYDSGKSLIHARVLVSKTDTMQDFIERIKEMFPSVAGSDLTVTEIQNSKITRIYMRTDSVQQLKEVDKVTVYELPRIDDSEEYIRLYQRTTNFPNGTSTIINSNGTCAFQYFGLPTLLAVSKSDNDWYSLKTRIFQRLTFLNQITNISNSLTTNNGGGKQSASVINSAADTLLNPKLIYSDYENMSKHFQIIIRTKQSKDSYLVLTPDTPRKSLQNTTFYDITLEWTNESREKYYDDSFDIAQDHISINLKSSTLNIQSCFNEFIKKEKLGQNDLWYCKRCKLQKAATKKFDLWQLPKVLILHLKRFRSGYYRRDKIDNFVEFPLNDLDLRKFVEEAHHDASDKRFKSTNEIYDLVAVSNHMGGLGGGHYTAYARNFIDQNWYLFDDSHTSKIVPESVISKSAYVLVYVSQSTLAETRAQLNLETNGDYDNTMAVDY